MKTFSSLNAFWIVLLTAVLSLASPLFAEDNAIMYNAMDLVHKAWNPEGKPPADAKKVKLLNQAMEILANVPPATYDGHKRKAMRFINSALFEIKLGDPDHKVIDYIQDAEQQLRSAIADAN